jgi:hypothetical protein
MIATARVSIPRVPINISLDIPEESISKKIIGIYVG